MSSKLKLSDAIKAISNNTSQTLVTSKKKSEKKPVAVIIEDDEHDTKFNESFDVGKKKGDVTYKKLQLHEQILLRPDTYIGSCKNIPSSDPIYVKVGEHIKEKNITYPEGLVRLFVEAVSNAIDNTWRSLQENITPKFIKINIADNKISVWNDGKNIPLDLHPEEKIPIPELIFGNLLTSSNYNDNEERKTSGKNGLGIKCVSPETNIPLWEGEIKKANKIVVGDKLIGDDGTIRTVKNIVEGRGKMYRIEQSLGEPYDVNENHILTLHMPDHKVIFWNNTSKCWNVLWWDKIHMKISKKQFRAIEKDKQECSECGIYISSNMNMGRVHPDIPIVKKQRKSPINEAPDTKEVIDSKIQMEEFCKTIPDEDGIFDISLQDYLNLDKATQGRLAGIRAKAIDYEKKEVSLDPYIFGLWLGDGLSSGRGFAINENMDKETREYIIEWGKNNDATFTLNSNARTLTCTSTVNKHKHHPLRKILNQYNLIDNKHIPKDYLLNDRETRLKVLAGFIDTDGTAMRDGTRIIISQGMNHEELMYELVFLVRSLGFACSLRKGKTAWTHKGEKKTGEALYANISGEGLEEIPTLLPRKKCSSPKSHNTSKTTGKITVIEKDEGDFVGIEIDGNSRFAINDFTITHNCSNIFSSMFTLEIYNKDAGKIYTQVWRDNMYKKEPVSYKTKGFPKTVEDGKNGYTMVEFIPDFKRFGVEVFTDDIMALFEKLIYDTAMTVSLKGVKVIYNGSLVPVNNIKDYVKLYFEEEPKDMMTLASKDCKVVVCPNNEFTHVSFVNGIYTKDGGVHVKKWSDTIFKPISEKINTTLKDKSIDISHIKKHFFIFIYADVTNPLFGNQNKTRFDGPTVEAELKEPELKKLMKWDFVEKIKDTLKSKELSNLKNQTERKRGTVNVEGLKDANFAGKKGKSTDCVCCITEGDSANTYAVAGMKYGLKFGDKEVKGRDYIGSLPVRGKFLNVRNASIQSLLKNTEVKSLIQAFDLQFDVDYSIDENFKKLRYGKLMAIVDADLDGYHITGLLFNFIHKLFPSLAKRKGFFNLMRIPIVKIGGKHNKSFFSQYSAEEYIEKNKPKKDDIKYFKGLGTAQDEDIEEDFGRRIVEFEVDENGDQMMVNIFGKENADFRKEWITNYENTYQEEGKDYVIQDLTVSNFLNNEMILFSIDDCKRSIPSMTDGLKESQRKILFSAFKRRLLYNDKSVKVAQFSGYVAEHSSYHHGEQNLVDTTVKLAQTFVGSNNIPLFFNEGQFGSRSMNGSDAASGRYLFTKLNLPTRNIFRPEDDDFLKDRVEEGEIVEKEFYLPIVPMILVNGCSAGIGSGFSSSVPSYKLEDIITQIDNWLDRKDPGSFQKDFDEIKPWYRGFNGNIIVDGKKIITEGVYEKVKEKTYRVTELPIGKANISIDKYEEFLKKLQEEKQITSFSSNCTESIVDFTINVTEDFEVSHKSLNLIDSVYTSNMVLFDPSNKIKKYETVQDILEEFCSVRYSLYEVRKEGIIKSLEEELLYLRNKIKFIGEIINNTISLKERDDESLNNELTTKKYALKEGSYDYLLNIQVRSMTSKRIKELTDKETDVKHQLDRYRIKSIKDIWRGEMDDLVKDYNKWLEFENGRKVSKKKVVKKGKK